MIESEVSSKPKPVTSGSSFSSNDKLWNSSYW